MQIDNAIIDQITQNLLGVFQSVGHTREEMIRKIREVVQEGADHFNLITREEFEVSRELLANTRIKVETLEKRLAELEAALTGKDGG
ncbi:MAG: accessory factor UbiK family protein [Magnetococcales bacterium]|nr:accessory factor UbiK family protein [Magnetococcales bacterium]MBF0155612.1 accessory factor UbiK family protein [Magnetococcales bacterium]